MKRYMLMSPIIVKSKNEQEQVNNLLDKSIPTYRQAFSDRTAWLMSCLSELAYIRFNPLFSNNIVKDYFTENVSKLVNEQKKSSLLKLIDFVGYDHEEERRLLISELKTLNFKLEETFDVDGTQAILISSDKFLVLAFRGTEATSIKDIKSDANAIITICDSGGMIHSGFNDAFNKVSLGIQKELNKELFIDKPLFITGHSLGGALATVASKKINHNAGIAACYTFGSPRVGDETWVAGIKAPVYRLVNAADCVTMMPPGAETIALFSWLAGLIPKIGPGFRKLLLSKFGGYFHSGDMRYLTNCNNGDFNKVQLLPYVAWIRRIKALILKKLPWKKFLADHSISVYRKKLMIIATRRNK